LFDDMSRVRIFGRGRAKARTEDRTLHAPDTAPALDRP
jgi:hypothetical protein